MVDICKKCGLPDDLCACGELEKEETRIVVRLEKRRFNKDTTMIEGFNPKLTDLVKIVKQLKNRFYYWRKINLENVSLRIFSWLIAQVVKRDLFFN